MTTKAAVKSSGSFLDLRDRLRQFAKVRDWDQFHLPKNLAIALSVEASELLEHFQWLKDESSAQLTRKQMGKIRDEMADVLLYLIRIADKLNIDLADAALKKIKKNSQKYPVMKSKGSSKKYTEL